MQWWYAKPPIVSAAYLSPGNGRATVTASENRLGPDLAGLCPEQERKELIEMLASRPGDDYQLAREPLKLEAILARAQRGYGQNYRGWDQEEKIASIAVPLRSEQRVIGCLNLVYMASAMTIEQAAEKHLPALQRVAKQIEEGLNRRLFW